MPALLNTILDYSMLIKVNFHTGIKSE